MFVFLLAALSVLTVFHDAAALQNPPAPAKAPSVATLPGVDDAFVKKCFGTEFTLKTEFAPITGDMDGDGVEDLVLIAQARNPMLDEGGFGYIVQDPYHSYFGFGDPKITSGFGSEDPDRKGFVLLIIHGTGEEAWRAATPKAKFVLINIPFKEILGLRRVRIKKKVVPAIGVAEYGGTETTSAIYWDGKKKYKYEPLGSAMD
ncbi:MAG TPA: hypothetical protein VEU31_06665 [Candidatus Acidoferrales bacterium]|nr:hypothetical protein [Candidatus Acidoferrales bacterium]